MNPGELLARIVQPGRLRADLRIPETQAQDKEYGKSQPQAAHCGDPGEQSQYKWTDTGGSDYTEGQSHEKAAEIIGI